MWHRWVGECAVLFVVAFVLVCGDDGKSKSPTSAEKSSSTSASSNKTETTTESNINTLKPEYRHPKGVEIFDPYNSEHILGKVPPSDDEIEEEGEELDGEDYFDEKKYDAKNYDDSKEVGGAELLPLGGGLLHGSDSLPYFLVEPQNSYVVKSKPATLNCRAANALQVYFMCNEERITKSKQYDLVDPQSGVRVVEAEYNITYDDVEEYFGKDRFKCECYAWTSRGQVPSRPAVIEIAYIKKQFPAPPHSVAVALNGQATLKCKPPAAAPVAKVSWLKDGTPLVPGDSDVKFVLSEEGAIKFPKVTAQDVGNYSCVAENIAGKRISEPASLSVYEDNGWSPWSGWVQCRCGMGKKRTRTCNRAPCNGNSVQRFGDCSCHTAGELPGKWGPWSVWSTCGSDCQQSRRRTCLGPPCNGREVQHAGCIGGYCPVSGANDARMTGGSATRNDLPLYIGMAVSLIVFACVTVAVFFLMKRKKRDIYTRGRSDVKTDLFPDSEKPLAPDLMQHARNSERPVPAYTRTPPLSEHYYDVPQITTSYSSPAERQTTPCMLTESDDYEHKPYNDSGNSVSSGLTSSGSTYSAATEQVALAGALASLVGESAWSAVGDLGGVEASRLWLPEPKVRLFLPHNACPRRSRLHLAVLRDTRPHLPKGVIQLSPVVKTGPIDVPLSKPAIIEVPHCANHERGYWSFSVYATDRSAPKNSRAYWRKLVDVGHETIDTPVYTHIDPERAFLVVDFLSTFVLVGESLNNRAVKNIQVAAYGPPLEAGSNEYIVRVYIIDNTRSALLQCAEREKRLGGEMLSDAKVIPYRDGGSSLSICLENVGYGWKARAGEAYRDVAFDHIWHGSSHGISCTLTLERTATVHDILEFSIASEQKNDPSSRQTHDICIKEYKVRIIENPFEGRQSREEYERIVAQRKLRGDDEDWRFLRKSDNNSTPTRSIKSDVPEEERRLLPKQEEKTKILYLEEEEECWKLPKEVMAALCSALDPPGEWATVARALGLARRPAHWAARASPMSHVLALWHAQNRCDPRAPATLARLLRELGHVELASLLDHCV